MWSSGLVTTMITASGDPAATASVTPLTILALASRRSIRDMPGPARQPGGDHHDVAPSGVGVVVGPHDQGAVALDGPRLVHVERQALGKALDDVGHHDLVDQIRLGEALHRRRPVLPGPNHGHLAHVFSRFRLGEPEG